MTWCKCPACDEQFSGITLFDKHRYGSWDDRRCLSPEEMRLRGWRKIDAVWKDRALTKEEIARLRK
jgi:hypothetical protein